MNFLIEPNHSLILVLGTMVGALCLSDGYYVPGALIWLGTVIVDYHLGVEE